MKYEEMIKKLEDEKKATETEYLDELSEHILKGISRFGFVDLVVDSQRERIMVSEWNICLDILIPQRVFFMIRRKLSEHFNIINIRCDVYRLTLI